MRAEKLVEAFDTTIEKRMLAWALIQSLGHRQMVDLLQASALESLSKPELLDFSLRMKALADSLEHAIKREV